MRETLEKTEIREWAIMENGGQQIFGVLHRPAWVENPPVVVSMHGFASSKHGSNRCYVTIAERLAKEGIATLRFDFRGSGDSEGHLSEISFEDMVSDAVHVVEQLGTLEGLDTNRVALFGASLGGSIAVLAASQLPKVKAMALWAPVASGELWYRDFLNRYPEHVNTDPGKILSTYKGVKLHPQFHGQFARMFAYKTMPTLPPFPILHMHGEKDDTISIAHQEAFRAACPHRPDLKFVKFPDAQHSLGYSQSFPAAVEEIAQWFHQHL